MSILNIFTKDLVTQKALQKTNHEHLESPHTLVLPILCSSLLLSACHFDAEDYYNSSSTANNDEIVAPNTPKNQVKEYEDGLTLMAYNVYLMNTFLSSWQQEQRAEYLANSQALKGHDVVILNELFDDESSQILLDGLKAEYPHQTPILARTYSENEINNGDAGSKTQWDESLGNISKQAFEDGGVAIISRWPIKEQIQYVYQDGCGTDNLGKKGFVYTLVNKNGEDYHVIGTHAQSEDSQCEAGDPAKVRKSQFTEIRQFITAKNIPKDRILFIGGDFNVIKDSAEYSELLEILDVNAPNSYAGFNTSWDPESNGIAATNYPDATREYLDYVFVSKQHAQPSYWHNQAIDELSPRWENNNRFYEELSDHYPIAAFAYADTHTRTKSYRFINRPYANITFRDSQNRYLTVNTHGQDITDKSLSMNGVADNIANSFNLDNWYPQGQAFCIRDNDYVRMQSNIYKKNYWADGNNNYIMAEQPLDGLRIEILNDDGDCLQNDDKVVFSYVDKESEKTGYFQQSNNVDTNADIMTLSFDGKEKATILTVEMQAGEIHDWTSKLTYTP